MPNIVISNLRPAGVELFDGSESFMNDLTDSELDITKGGSIIEAFLIGVGVGIAITYELK